MTYAVMYASGDGVAFRDAFVIGATLDVIAA